MAPSISEPGAVYEVKLVAYNGNGESDSSTRLVSLVEERMSNPTTGEYDCTLCLSKHPFVLKMLTISSLMMSI